MAHEVGPFYPKVNPLPHSGSTLLQVGKGPSLEERVFIGEGRRAFIMRK